MYLCVNLVLEKITVNIIFTKDAKFLISRSLHIYNDLFFLLKQEKDR